MTQSRPTILSLLPQTLPILLISALITLIGGTHAAADEKSLSVPAVVAKVRPSVVTILTRGMPAAPSQHGTQSGSGSGIVIDAVSYTHLTLPTKA